MARFARPWSLLVMLTVGATLLPAAAVAQSDATVFRPACELADDTAGSSSLGVDVVGDDSISLAICAYKDGDVTVAHVTLDSEVALALMRLALPDAMDITVAGRPALTSPGDESGIPATVAVALDDGGVLMVQVLADAGVDDPASAAAALAEVVLAAGPVTARQPVEATGSPIEFPGDPCTIVSLAELTDIVGKEFTTSEPDATGTGCTFQTASNRAPVFVNVGLAEGTLGDLRSGKSEDLTIADRAALFWPDVSGLFVDAGGGRLLQVVIASTGQPNRRALQRVLKQATSVAELAVGRMTPSTEQPVAPPTADCALLSLQGLESATGLVFEVVPSDGDETCVFVTRDQRASIILATSEYASLDDAWSEAQQALADLPAATALDVAGHPAYWGQGDAGAIIAVDLAGVADMEGKVLGVILSGFPIGVDQLELARQVAEQVIAAM